MNRLFLSYILILMPIVVNAYDVIIDGIYYNLDKETYQAEVTSGGKKYIGNIVIPVSFWYGKECYSVTSIGEKAFYDCIDLQSVHIPEGISTIGGLAFSWCTSLSVISLPNSIKSLGWFAFYGCTNLVSIQLPASMDYIEYGAFSHCSKLTSLNIPDGLTVIDRFVFEECESLNSIVIPEGVQKIGSLAFYGCSSMKTVILPASIKMIGEETFETCTSLIDVYCYAEEVPIADVTTFDNQYIDNAKLHVTAFSLAAYKSTFPWNGFGSIVAFDPAGVKTLESTQQDTDGKYMKNGKLIIMKDGKKYNAVGRPCK